MKKLSIISVSLLIVLNLLIFSCKPKSNKDNKNTSDTTQQTTMIPLEDFFKNPEQTAYQISPNGEYYSFMSPYKDRLNVFVQKIGEADAKRITSSTVRNIGGYFWTNNSKILYLQDTGGDENQRLYGVNIDGTDSICYTNFEGVKTQIIDNLVEIPNEIIIGINKRNPQIFDAYRLFLDSGEMEMIAENPGNIQGWITDHEGKLRAATTIDGTNTSILYRETEEDEWQTVIVTDFKESFNPQFFTFDNKNFIGVSNIGRDKAAVVEFNVETKKETVLFENKDNDISYASYSKKRKVITAAIYTSWKKERHFFDDKLKKDFEIIEKQLEGYEIAITGNTRNEDIYIVRTYSDRSLGTYYIYDTETEKLDKIVDVSPWINENDMATCFPVQYKTRDGLNIHGYLTLPKGLNLETAKNLPTVINPHGGPWARDSWGFNPEVQFLANRGYAVLQMNFRGSVGYGREFLEKSFKQWGLTMQDDITDGTNWLVEKGISDPKNIAIYGGSYGGYATLMGLVKEPKLYAAGVDYVGVSNMFTFIKAVPEYWKPMLDMMYEMIGNPVADSVYFKQVSPVYHVDKIVAPLFVAQGKNDPRVNIEESDQIVDAMKARNIDIEYMVKDDEGHGFHNQENKFDFYRAMEKFLAKHLDN